MGKREVLIVIPARYSSKRLPGKPLIKIGKKPMIQHVYEKALLSKFAKEVVVATDDPRVYSAVLEFGGNVIMTKGEHSSGSERCLEVARKKEHPVIVNLQGDEPLIEPDMIDLAIEPVLLGKASISTLASTICEEDELYDPNVVKVVTDLYGFALYFSRSKIPYNGNCEQTLKHIGIYVYEKEIMEKVLSLPKTPLEMRENLEQLRFLEHGYKIKVSFCHKATVGVDTQKDLERVRQILEGR